MTDVCKVLGPQGEPIHGGTGAWSLPKGKRPGKWMPRVERVECCRSGYHLVEIHTLPQWLAPDCTIYVAEGRGASHTDGSGKTAFAQARLVRRVYLSDRALRLFAADCAEHVLHLFEAEYPTDDRPRKAIAAARAYAHGEITDAARAAAWAAARDAAWDAAWAAAASSASHAAGGAARGAAWDAARTAAWGAAWAAERSWQGERLAHYMSDAP